MSLLPPSPISGSIVEVAGLRIFTRAGSADELIVQENLVRPYVQKHLDIVAGDKWLDIGGFIGTFALFCHKAQCPFFSVEASPDNAHIFYKNMALNDIRDYHLLEAAVLAERPKDGYVDLHIAPHYAGKLRAGGASLHGATNFAMNTVHNRWKRDHPVKRVPAVTFERVVALAQEALGEGGVWCLKIDIEGAEVDILENCDLSIFQKIFFEYHYQAGGGPERAARVFDRLRSLGFTLKLNRPVKFGELRWNETYHLGWAVRI